MKNIVLILFLALASPLVTANELPGVWQLVSGEYVDGNGELVQYRSIGLKSLKVVSATHFSFTSMKGGEFWASGSGTYELGNGTYAEKLLYNSFGEKPGTVFSFDTRLEGDVWYNSRWEDGKRVEYEVWRRVE